MNYNRALFLLHALLFVSGSTYILIGAAFDMRPFILLGFANYMTGGLRVSMQNDLKKLVEKRRTLTEEEALPFLSTMTRRRVIKGLVLTLLWGVSAIGFFAFGWSLINYSQVMAGLSCAGGAFALYSGQQDLSLTWREWKQLDDIKNVQ